MPFDILFNNALFRCSVCSKMLLNFCCLTFKLRISMHMFLSYPVWASKDHLSTETPFSCCNGKLFFVCLFFPYLLHPSAQIGHELDWLTHSPHSWWFLEPRCTCFLLFVLAQYHGRLNYAFWVPYVENVKKKKALHIWSKEFYLTLQMCKRCFLLLFLLSSPNSYGFSL